MCSARWPIVFLLRAISSVMTAARPANRIDIVRLRVAHMALPQYLQLLDLSSAQPIVPML
jgi:hypothetical protein